jgi:hypothetical protein
LQGFYRFYQFSGCFSPLFIRSNLYPITFF